MKLIITLASATILSAIAAQARGAPVTWTFYETGCTLSGGPCNAQPPVPFPYPLATLILPGPTSSGTAFWQGGLPPAPAPVYTGDNFTFEYAGIFITPAFNGEPNCLEGHGLCEFDLSWSEVGGELESIALNALSDMDQIGYRGSFGLTGGVFGSDGTVDDCFFAQCVATGFWQSNLPVPEPMTTSLLLSGLLGLALTRRFLRP